MIQNVVKVPFRKLKHIHHISDIQIRNLKRHTEYEEVFNRLYEKVKENKENAVAYIGGDIAHSKTDMSPELVDQLSRLFKNLSDIVPLLIIAGNHDCNLNNRSRMDVLTPIVENLNHPNLHYLKDSGVYTCADTQFVVWDCWSDEKDFITADQVEGDTKIVLFHGTVDRCETDLGYRLPSDVKITKFDGYDMGLLGDIHKRQHLNKEETISYCGSLVQQNHGEGLDHGYLLWDVPKRKSKYIRIHNDYGYYTMDITEGKVPRVDDIPKKARLRVRVSDTDSVQLKKALSVIQTKYGIKEIAVTRTDRLTERVRDGQVVDVGDVQNPDFQYELIEDYLGRNHIVDEKTLLKIKDINDIDKEKLISNAYLLLMTSISRNEAFGVVLVEALRSGLPLISPNIKSGVSWINEHNETGYQYNTGNFDDMLDKINKLMRIDKKNYDKMCKNAQTRYKKYFKLNTMMKKIENVYSSALNG